MSLQKRNQLNIFSLCELFEKICATASGAIITDPPTPLITEPPAPLIPSTTSIKLPNGEEILEKDVQQLSKYKPTLEMEFWQKFIEMAADISPAKTADATLKIANLMAKVIQAESGFNPRAVAKNKTTGNPIAKGLAQMLKTVAVKMGMTPEQWDALDTPAGLTAIQQLPFVHKLFKGYGIKPDMTKEDVHAKNFGGYYTQPKGPKGEEIAYAGAEYTKNSGQKHPNPEYQEKAYKANIFLDIVLGPDGKAVLDGDGNPVRKGFISKNDLSQKAAKARAQIPKKKS